MSQGIEIDSKMLDEWIANFRNNTSLPFSTNYGSFSQEQLKQYIEAAKTSYGEAPTDYRIYPVRYSITGAAGDGLELEPGSTFSRPAFVFVPIGSDTGKFMINKNDKVFVLAFGYTGDSGDVTTRAVTAGFPSDPPKLCPPKC